MLFAGSGGLDDQVDFLAVLTTSRSRHPTITWPLIVVGGRNVETERCIVSRIERPTIPDLASHGKKLHLVVHHGQAEHSFRLRLHVVVSKLFHPGRFGMF